MNTLGQFLNGTGGIYTFILICVAVGGFFALRNGKRLELTKFQKETITALQDRINVMEDKIGDLEKTNLIQQHVIETITSALKQRGMVITIDGDMVTIADKSGNSTSRKRVTTTTHGITVKEEKAD